MEIAGYIVALLIGISLGLIGGGGSILTIPALVYLFHIQPTLATGYSLFIVGCSSLTGAALNYKKGHINLRAAFFFGISSIITVVLIRKLVIPVIPEHLFSIGSWQVSRSLATMLLFAVVMIIASLNMLRKEPLKEQDCEGVKKIPLGKAVIKGIETGILTGFLGAGGGFIIIPVLLFSFRLTMKEAIGTSLLIIAMNSLFGFASDLYHQSFNWTLLLLITAIAVAGTVTGALLGTKIAGEKLKRGFGWFVLIMGCFIILKELFGGH